ncbi:hypothetical protein [Faecalibacillus intestinalis]
MGYGDIGYEIARRLKSL